ncbi:MAG: hypothetical protein IJI19_06160 [Ruminococcus sp.]|nr:hypothetical protein [Ruminococcus sp.]
MPRKAGDITRAVNSRAARLAAVSQAGLGVSVRAQKPTAVIDVFARCPRLIASRHEGCGGVARGHT